jgi:hypothetical protein
MLISSPPRATISTDVRPNWIERPAMGAFTGTTIRDVKWRKQTRSFFGA